MKKSICVIDDDKIHQLIIRKIIARIDLFEEPACYENCLEAIDQLKNPAKHLPDLILLDLNMEEMNGWQFLEYLRSYRPDLAAETTIYIVILQLQSPTEKRQRPLTR